MEITGIISVAVVLVFVGLMNRLILTSILLVIKDIRKQMRITIDILSHINDVDSTMDSKLETITDSILRTKDDVHHIENMMYKNHQAMTNSNSNDRFGKRKNKQFKDIKKDGMKTGKKKGPSLDDGKKVD